MESGLPMVNAAEHEFKVPVKKIMEGDSLKEFQESETYKEILTFIVHLQKSVQGTKMTTTECPECLVPLYDILNKYEGYIDEIPPTEQPMRFGNKAFKTWLDKVKETFEEDMNTLLTTDSLQRGIAKTNL
jgi:serine/threonine-protein phosphatase 2A activator